MSEKKSAICLVSGGLDSCVSAAIARKSFENLAFLHVNYGQKTEKRELRAFMEIADYYGIQKRLIADIGYLAEIGGSALTDTKYQVPENELSERGIPITYVPFRNTHIIAIAVSWGEVIEAERIFIGATEQDSSGYPDCRKTYFDAYNRLIQEGSRPETNIRIETPLIDMRKKDVVEAGISLGAPLHLTWSCYQDEEYACGICDSCLLRLKGFREAGVKDPVLYRKGVPGRQ